MIVSRALCTHAVRSHGSDETLPLQWWRSASCVSCAPCDRADL